MTKTEKVIKDLGASDFSTSNDEQMKMVQLLKGIALSDEKVSDVFMKKLDTFITKLSSELLQEDNGEDENEIDDKNNKDREGSEKPVIKEDLYLNKVNSLLI